MSIKVLHCITGIDLGGAEQLLLSTVRKLDKEKFNISVCYFKGKGALRAEFESTGVRVFFLGDYSHWTIGKAIALGCLLSELSPEIVHTHLILATIVGRIIAWYSKVPVIVTTEHNISNWQKKYFLLFSIYKITTMFTDKIFAISEAVKKQLIMKGKIKSEKITVLYDGVDLSIFDPKLILEQSHYADSAYPIIGCISRLDQRKGIRFLIEAITILKSQYPHIKLIIVGDGKERQRLESMATEHEVTENVFFTGEQKNVIPYFQMFDIFVLPSLSEGLSVSLIEAMAMKKTIIATNVGGIPEVVANGKEGILVPPGQANEIASAIAYLLKNAKRANLMKVAARKKVERKFNLDILVKKLENFYETLVLEQ